MTRTPLLILSLTTALFGLTATDALALDTANPDKDGTYKHINVTSQEACSELCEADKACRGSQTIQPDTRFPKMECRLNNGFGETPLFPSTPPPPLSMDIALADLNKYRQQNGLNALIYNPLLNQASKVHAEDLARAGIISHTGTDGSSPAERVTKTGYKYSLIAENVATGQQNWPEAFKAWQDSPGHNVNLLRAGVTEFGVALVYNPKTQYQTYWAMLVATPLF